MQSFSDDNQTKCSSFGMCLAFDIFLLLIYEVFANHICWHFYTCVCDKELDGMKIVIDKVVPPHLDTIK